MQGSYRIQVRNNKVSFDVMLERNITVITGFSATGKTSLLNLIAAYEEYGKKSGVKLISERPCCAIRSGIGWYDKITKFQNSIIFIEEGLSFVHSHEFAKLLKGNTNYFVLVTREGLAQVPYSINSIIGIKEVSKKENCVYNESYKIHHK